jgi:hypothetical protein
MFEPSLRIFFMHCLTSTQALQLAADFAVTADYIRATDVTNSEARASFLEMASRAAFLKAQVIAKDEEIRPVFGHSFRRAAFAVA